MTPLQMQQIVIEAGRNKTRYLYSFVNKEFLKIDVPETKRNYKVAITFSGGLRNFDITMEWANKFLIDPLKADVFFHGWCNKNGIENNDKLIQGYHNLKKYKILKREDNPISIPEIMKNKYPRTVAEGLGMELAEHVLGQLYNIRNSYDLLKEYEKETGTKYDLVIRARPDVFWFDRIKDTDLDFTMENYCIATPQGYMSIICGPKHVNDQFAMSQNVIMEKFTRIFDKIADYSAISPDDSATEFFVTYQVGTLCLRIYNIDINFMLDYPIDYMVEKGFDHKTFRHQDQNDSPLAMKITSDIRKGHV